MSRTSTAGPSSLLDVLGMSKVVDIHKHSVATLAVIVFEDQLVQRDSHFSINILYHLVASSTLKITWPQNNITHVGCGYLQVYQCGLCIFLAGKHGRTILEIKSFSQNRLPCSSLLGKKGWPRYALATFLELVRHVSAICVRCGPASKPCPACVRLMSALASPPNLGRHASVRPCARLALYLPCVGFGRASKRCVSHVALCVRPCLFFVLSLSARCSLFICFLSVFGLWFGFGRAFVSSVSVLWFLRLFLFCVRCCPP